MADKVLHAIDIKNVVSEAVVGIVIGLLLTFVPMSALVGLIIVIIGILMMAINGYKLYKSVSRNENNNEMLIDCLGILLGFILISANNLIITIIVSIYLIVKPVILIVLNKKDKKTINNELPKVILGVILLVSGLSTLDILFKIVGIIVLVLSLVYLGYNYLLYKKSGVKIIEK